MLDHYYHCELLNCKFCFQYLPKFPPAGVEVNMAADFSWDNGCCPQKRNANPHVGLLDVSSVSAKWASLVG